MAERRLIPYGISRNLHLVARHMGTFWRHNTPTKFANLCSLYLQRWANRSVLSAFPVEVIVDPTNICQLNCPLCPTGQRAGSRPPGVMAFDLFQRIVDELARFVYKMRLYNWGEPLIHKDIYRMIAYAARANIGTEISTHLNFLGASDASRLVDSGLELLIVSLDAADQDTYVRYRVGGDFDKVIANIRAIVDEKRRSRRKYPLIEIQFLVMAHNESHVPRMRALAEELGVDNLRFGPVTINMQNREDRQWLPADERLSRYCYQGEKDLIYARRRKCEWLWRSAVINWDGTVAPCCVYEGEKAQLGSLEDSTFGDVWNNAYYRSARETFINRLRGGGRLKTICGWCKGMPTAADPDQHGLY